MIFKPQELLCANILARKDPRQYGTRQLKVPGARFSKVPRGFRNRKAVAKFQTLWLQSSFIYIFLIWPEVSFIQEVSGVYTFLLLDTD